MLCQVEYEVSHIAECRRAITVGERLDVLPLELGLFMGAQGGMNDPSY